MACRPRYQFANREAVAGGHIPIVAMDGARHERGSGTLPAGGHDAYLSSRSASTELIAILQAVISSFGRRSHDRGNGHFDLSLPVLASWSTYDLHRGSRSTVQLKASGFHGRRGIEKGFRVRWARSVLKLEMTAWRMAISSVEQTGFDR